MASRDAQDAIEQLEEQLEVAKDADYLSDNRTQVLLSVLESHCKDLC